MRVEITEAGETERGTVEAMAQLYQYDFTEFVDSDLAPNGRFAEIDIGRFFGQKDRRVYIARVDGRLAGFALVSRQTGRSPASSDVWYMSEFFVMRKYRRFGVGTKLATSTFDAHPGAWEVAQMRANLPAQAFWRQVISRFTGGEFKEIDLDDDHWDGPMQYFTA